MSPAPSNRAAWIDAVNQFLRVGPADLPVPGPNEVVICNKAIAINPIDWKIVDRGWLYTKWPNILGSDVAGEIFALGPNVRSGFKTGDRVVAHLTNGSNSEPREGGYQLYSVASADLVARIPDSISFAEAAVLPLAFDTALIGLCAQPDKGLGLPLPSLEPQPCNKTIILWGGSSSVGALVTQLAVAGGMKVIAVTSEKNFDFCRACGATAVVDYHRATVVDDVVGALRSVGGELAGVYDAISQQESYKFVLEILEKLGGGRLQVVLGDVPKPLPANVEVSSMWAINPEVVKASWKDFIPQALAEGKLKCLPKPMVVGPGLEALQKGLDIQREGVSAAKVVIEL